MKIIEKPKEEVHECHLYDKNKVYLETVYMTDSELKEYNNEKAEFCIKFPASKNMQY